MDASPLGRMPLVWGAAAIFEFNFLLLSNECLDVVTTDYCCEWSCWVYCIWVNGIECVSGEAFAVFLLLLLLLVSAWKKLLKCVANLLKLSCPKPAS